MKLDASTVEIKVQPEVLDLKAQEVLSAVNKMEQIINSIQTTVSRTQYYWVGDAGNVHRKMFAERKDDVNMILARLKEHPVDLQKIANTYRSAERNLAELARQLPSDLID